MHIEKIGLLGFGTVGSGVYQILSQEQVQLSQKAHVELVVEQALVRNPEEMQQRYPEVRFTDTIEEIVNDDAISIVVEVMGGVDFAYDCVKQALLHHKHVVTANKDLIAKHGVELTALAQEQGVYLYYEASVGGGIPVLRPLVDHVASNDVLAMYGIVNGTTNFMVTSMAKKDWSYDEALAVAQQSGFAEADPTSDVEGYDAVRKLIILTRLAFGVTVSFDDVPKRGITKISKQAMQVASENGYVIKLLASAIVKGDEVYLEVTPTFVPQTHLLAQVDYENNAISITGNMLDEIVLYGKGAGSLPTATSVVSDLVKIATDNARHAAVRPFASITTPLKRHTQTAPTRSYAIISHDGVFKRMENVTPEAIHAQETVEIYPILED